MAVKLIAENILSADKFLSATEQEGEHIGQPAPDSTNTGAFRLLAKGDIQNFTYNGTATGDGAVGGTTVIDSVLAAYGDDYFIDGEVEITSGAANGETQSITDFAQATGTVTTAAFSAQILTGVTFTLTVAFASRDIRAELIAGGDAGAATFKWSHDGGTTHLGRDDPNQASWLYEKTTMDADNPYTVTASGIPHRLVVAANGDWFHFYCTATAIKYARSIDEGKNWLSPQTIRSDGAADYNFQCALRLSTSRILLYYFDNTTFYGYVVYSDDDGVDWGDPVNIGYALSATCVIELIGENALYAVFSTGTVVVGKKSTDGGFTWSSSSITIASDANSQTDPFVAIAENGDYVCVYSSDEDAVGDYEIKAKISATGGATWGSAVDVIDFGAADIETPCILKDISGRLFCAAYETGVGVVLVYSDDNGVTWNSGSSVVLMAGTNYQLPHMLIVKNQIICSLYHAGGTDLRNVRRGIWEAYSANACPVAIEAQEQKLICDAGIVWHGGAGIAGDKWTITPEYDYAMSNIIEDSPLKPWRSEQDNIACHITIDMGANERFLVDGVGFFGCNVRELDFQRPLLWYCDVATDTIYCIKEDGILVSSFPTSTFDVSATTPTGVAVGYDGTLWVVDTNTDKVYNIETDGTLISSFLTSVFDASATNTGGIGADPDGTLWVVDTNTDKVYNIETDGTLVASFNAPSTDPQGISVGTDGTLWICDNAFNMIYNRNRDGSGIDSFPTVTFDAAASTPVGISAAPDGTLWICDATTDKIYNVQTDGSLISSFSTSVFDASATIPGGVGASVISKSVSFDLATGIVDSVSGNYINDASLMANYKDHKLKANPHYLRMTSGTDNGVTWKIKDNVGDYIVLDTTAATNIAATDTFVIFQDHVTKTFTAVPCRHISPTAISAQHTAENYYQIGTVVMGKAITLSRGFAVGYSKDHQYDIEMLRPPKGGMIPIKGRARKRIFSLTWPAAETTREEIVALLDYVEGKNICLIPDDSNMSDCYLVKHVGSVKQKHRFIDRFDVGPLIFEEV